MHSENSDQTEAIGHKIGRQLKGGEVIELISDLGGGKTTLVRGITAGFGSKDKVASPTFTISREYVHGDLKIVHYDFYRLHDPGLMAYELAEAINDPLAIVIVEWADIVQDVLPKDRLAITIKTTGENSRDIALHATGAARRLLE